MLSDTHVTSPARSRLAEVDYSDLGFGRYFSDHMFTMVHEDSRWQRPEIVPFAPISMHPANAALHYGQAVFEGLKAYRGVDGAVRVFRPDMNASRLRASCERLCIPTLPDGLLEAAIDRLVAMDHAWIPGARGQALYIRPVVFSDEGHLEVRPSARFRLVIVTSPVRAYFDTGMRPIALKAEQTYTRSAPGGVGYAKTSGNYGASLYPGQQGLREGYAQVLWLDGIEHRYVEEVGAMNIFFRLGDVIVTPDLHGTILPGVTRDSAIALLEEAGHRVEQRRVALDEVLGAARNGTLREVFASGTAAIIAPVGAIAFQGREHAVGNGAAGDLTRWLYEQITGIQHGELDDRFGWCRRIEPAASSERRRAR